MKKNQLTNAILTAFSPDVLERIKELKRQKETLFQGYKKERNAITKQITKLRGNVGINSL